MVRLQVSFVLFIFWREAIRRVPKNIFLHSRLFFVVMRFFNTVERPYRIPLNTFGCALFLTPSSLLCVYVLVAATKVTYIYFLALASFGLIFHMIQKSAKHYHWWQYVEAPPKKRRATPTCNNANNNNASSSFASNGSTPTTSLLRISNTTTPTGTPSTKQQ